MQYINNKEMYDLLAIYLKTKDRKVYNELGKMFLLIATNKLNQVKTINYTQDRKDEMVSDAVYAMCRYIDRYNLKQTNPFAYFSSTAHNAFLQYLNERKKIDDKFTSVEYIDNCDSVYEEGSHE